jgi:hypothetical protein
MDLLLWGVLVASPFAVLCGPAAFGLVALAVWREWL